MDSRPPRIWATRGRGVGDRGVVGDQQDGLGLGLSIVAAIATAHGALLTTQARPTGGLDVEVAFP